VKDVDGLHAECVDAGVPASGYATRYVRRREAVGNARVRACGSEWQPDPRGPVEHEGDMIDMDPRCLTRA
jgi:hypothetical protein